MSGKRFFISCNFLLLILGSYYLYGWVLVPLVLPTQTALIFSTEQQAFSEVHREEFEPYASLFSPEMWESQSKRDLGLIGKDNIVILWKKDLIKGPTVHLEPCTLIILPSEDPNVSLEERVRQAVVLRTEDRAEIDFAEDVNFGRSPLPPIIGGRLFGKVTITSDMKNPGPDDDLDIVTETVVFTESPALTHLQAPKDVQFRFGGHSGEGSRLQIDLAKIDPNNAKAGKTLSRLQFETLKRMQLTLSEMKESLTPATAMATPKTAGNAGKTGGKPTLQTSTNTGSLLEMTCQREFLFYATETPNDWIAAFHGNVIAKNINPDKTIDLLLCETLFVNFRPKTNAPGKPTTAKGKTLPISMDAIEPVKFLAKGRLGEGKTAPIPVILTSPRGGGVELKGDQILHDLVKKEITVEVEKQPGASQEVVARLQGGKYVTRNEKGFLYQFSDTGGYGTLRANASGSLLGLVSANEVSAAANREKNDSPTTPQKSPENQLYVKWNALHVEPLKSDPTILLANLHGGVSVDLEGSGKLTGEQLYLYLKSRDQSADKMDGEKQSELVPYRMEVAGNVCFETEKGKCLVNHLLVCFEYDVEETLRNPASAQFFRGPPQFSTNPLTVRQTPMSPILQVQYTEPTSSLVSIAPLNISPVAPGPVPGSGTPRSSTPNTLLPLSRYDITANEMQLLVLETPQGQRIDNLLLRGDVRVIEKVVGQQPTDSVIEILSHELRIWNPTLPNMHFQISGSESRDAIFRGKGIELQAQSINLQRENNLLWSKCPGRLIARNMSASNKSFGFTQKASIAPTTEPRFVVEWNEQMWFDGKTVHFVGKRDRNRGAVVASTPSSNLFADTMRLNLNREFSMFDDKSSEPVDAVSIECSQNVFFRNESYENGEPTSLEEGRCDNMCYWPITGVFAATASDNAGFLRRTYLDCGDPISLPGTEKPSPPQTPAQKQGLKYIYLEFHDNMQGRVQEDYFTIEIEGSVQAIYCPVQAWDERYDLNNANDALKKGYLLQCKQLIIEQMPSLTEKKSTTTMKAQKQASFEGNDIFVKGHSFHFDESKDLIIVSGGDFQKATIHGIHNGGRFEYSSNVMEYNLKTHSVKSSSEDGFVGK